MTDKAPELKPCPTCKGETISKWNVCSYEVDQYGERIGDLTILASHDDPKSARDDLPNHATENQFVKGRFQKSEYCYVDVFHEYVRADLHVKVKPLALITQKIDQHMSPDLQYFYTVDAEKDLIDPFNHSDPVSCGNCGAWMQVVRPGKHQCCVCGDDPVLEALFDLKNEIAALEPAPMTPAQAVLNEEYATDMIEEIIGETHDLDVTDRMYALNIVAWLKRHHPDALRAIAEGESE